ncbi:MAG: SHOCT domain-containing protein [Jiangellaceae bacterium]|jgi:type VI protein secretion system component VasK|nr:SHOCT domain-containing protein [Jiangellaceae bacterium]
MPLLDLFWTMLWFFLFIAWIWLLIAIVTDIFRSDDLSGFAKALWILFVIIVPWLGALIYLIARGGKMQDREMRDATERAKAQRQYIQEVASTSGTSSAEELTKLAQLRDSGVITADEFEAQKAKLLA